MHRLGDTSSCLPGVILCRVIGVVEGSARIIISRGTGGEAGFLAGAGNCGSGWQEEVTAMWCPITCISCIASPARFCCRLRLLAIWSVGKASGTGLVLGVWGWCHNIMKFSSIVYNYRVVGIVHPIVELVGGA